MPSTYPVEYDKFVYSYPNDLAHSILKLQERIGKSLESRPDTIEDRLYTLENVAPVTYATLDDLRFSDARQIIAALKAYGVTL